MLSSLGILILSSATEVMLVTLRSLLIRIFIVAQVSFRFLHRTDVSLWNAAFLSLFLEHWLFTSYFPSSANTIDFSFIAVFFSFSCFKNTFSIGSQQRCEFCRYSAFPEWCMLLDNEKQ